MVSKENTCSEKDVIIRCSGTVTTCSSTSETAAPCCGSGGGGVVGGGGGGGGVAAVAGTCLVVSIPEEEPEAPPVAGGKEKKTRSPDPVGWSAMSPLSFDGGGLVLLQSSSSSSHSQGKKKNPPAARAAPPQRRPARNPARVPGGGSSCCAGSNSTAGSSSVSFQARPVPKSTYQYQAPVVVRSSLANQLGFVPSSCCSVRNHTHSTTPTTPSVPPHHNHHHSSSRSPTEHEKEFWKKLYDSTPPFRVYPKAVAVVTPITPTTATSRESNRTPTPTPTTTTTTIPTTATTATSPLPLIVDIPIVVEEEEEEEEEYYYDDRNPPDDAASDDAVVVSPRILFPRSIREEDEEEEDDDDDDEGDDDDDDEKEEEEEDESQLQRTQSISAAAAVQDESREEVEEGSPSWTELQDSLLAEPHSVQQENLDAEPVHQVSGSAETPEEPLHYQQQQQHQQDEEAGSDSVVIKRYERQTGTANDMPHSCPIEPTNEEARQDLTDQEKDTFLAVQFTDHHSPLPSHFLHEQQPIAIESSTDESRQESPIQDWLLTEHTLSGSFQEQTPLPFTTTELPDSTQTQDENLRQEMETVDHWVICCATTDHALACSTSFEEEGEDLLAFPTVKKESETKTNECEDNQSAGTEDAVKEDFLTESNKEAGPDALNNDEDNQHVVPALTFACVAAVADSLVPEQKEEVHHETMAVLGPSLVTNNPDLDHTCADSRPQETTIEDSIPQDEDNKLTALRNKEDTVPDSAPCVEETTEEMLLMQETRAFWALVPYVDTTRDTDENEDACAHDTSEDDTLQTAGEAQKTWPVVMPLVGDSSNNNDENVCTDFAFHADVARQDPISPEEEEVVQEESVSLSDVLQEASSTPEEDQQPVTKGNDMEIDVVASASFEEGHMEDAIPAENRHQDRDGSMPGVTVGGNDVDYTAANSTIEFFNDSYSSNVESSLSRPFILLHHESTQREQEESNTDNQREEDEEEPSFWYRAAAAVADSSGAVRVHLSLFGGRQQQGSSSDSDEEHEYRDINRQGGDSYDENDTAGDDNSSSAEEIIFVPQTTRDLVAQHILQRHQIDRPLSITVGFLPRIDSVGSSAAASSCSVAPSLSLEEVEEERVQEPQDSEGDGDNHDDADKDKHQQESAAHNDGVDHVPAAVPWYAMRISAGRLGKNVVLAVAIPYLLAMAAVELKQQQQVTSFNTSGNSTNSSGEHFGSKPPSMTPPAPHPPYRSAPHRLDGSRFFRRRRPATDEWDEHAAVRELVDSTARVLERGNAILQQVRENQEAALDDFLQESVALVVRAPRGPEQQLSHSQTQGPYNKKSVWRNMMTQSLLNLGGTWYLGHLFSSGALVPLGGIGQLPAWYGLVQTLQPVILMYAGLFNVVFPLMRRWATLRQQPQKEKTLEYGDKPEIRTKEKPLQQPEHGFSGGVPKEMLMSTEKSADSSWRPRVVVKHNKKRKRKSQQF